MEELNQDNNIQWFGEETTPNPLKINIERRMYNNLIKIAITMNKHLKELITEKGFGYWQIGIKKENDLLKLFFRFTTEDEGGYTLLTTEGKLKQSFQQKELLERLTQKIFFHVEDFSSQEDGFESTTFRVELKLKEAQNMKNTYVAEIKAKGLSQKDTKIKIL
ncbi:MULTISPECIES: hypothetical protein [Bacillus]|uniref:Uncharacterized protein n=1 Tax=Bacillus glycinifermentans TaxID=1664069 RepID=A0A0T6BHZ2_9BACI|nr:MULTISPECIES: hypothetical protein [Bacillus]KRT87063.1 hypothetical protein AB447_208840 [Bacillus glycinifermentans]MEC0341883.1 hypothetical protein [Bacillus sonorensis]MEC0457431.1 hypothetical protein [Bacillus sonorensis]MEC0487114.1 hypothetical protein [Bacillus glycinifermentans]MEC0530774.1 hypothetical protein [Bacillus sonorensis]